MRLNCEEVHEEAIKQWGPITDLPCLDSINLQIIKTQDLHGPDNVVILKGDLRNYYQLCFFALDSLPLMAFAVHSHDPSIEGSVYFSLAGNFGWTGLPNAFEVFTRIFRVIIGLAIAGHAFFQMYCDDFFISSSKQEWRADHVTAVRIVTTLFGSDSYAEEKFDSTEAESKSQREIDILGWNFNLTTNRCDVSAKNRKKGLLHFLSVDIDKPLSLRDRQRLVGFAERYSSVYRELQPMMIILYKMLGGQEHLSYDLPIPLSSSAKAAIMIWRIYLISSSYNYDHNRPSGRDISLWHPTSVRFCIEFDGSLYGLGYRVFKANETTCMVSGSVALPLTFFPDETRLSDYQNSVELMALVAGLIHLIRLGANTCSIDVRGDSATVLHWATSHKFRSVTAIPIIMLFTALCDHYKIHINSGIHISSEDNHICDALSRLDVSNASLLGLCGPAGLHRNSPTGLLCLAVNMCSIATTLSSEEQFFQQWEQVTGFCKKLEIQSNLL